MCVGRSLGEFLALVSAEETATAQLYVIDLIPRMPAVGLLPLIRR